MIITRIEIEGFGSLVNYSMDFSEKCVNEIYEKNGFGKSTISEFIKVMLFGFENETKSKDNSERKKYKPRRSPVYGGRLFFRCSDGNYIISKVFAEKPKEDIIELINADTKLPADIGGYEIGKSIFGIDAESYYNSAYFAQGDLKSIITPGIEGKANLETDSIDILNFDKTYQILYNNEKNIDGNRKDSLLPAIYAEKIEIEKKLSKKKALELQEIELEQTIIDCQKRRGILEEERRNVQEKINNLISRQEVIQLKRIYDDINRNIQERLADYDKSMNFFTNGIPEDFEIEEIMNCIEDYEKCEEELSQINSGQFSSARKVKKYVNIIIFVGIMLLFAGGFLLFQGQLAGGLVTIILGIALGITALISNVNNNFHNDENSNEYEKKRIFELNQNINKKRAIVSEWLKKYKLSSEDDTKKHLTIISVKKSELDRNGAEYERALKTLENFKENVDVRKFEEEYEDNTLELNQCLGEITNEIRSLDNRILDTKRKHEMIQDELIILEDYDEKYKKLLEKQKSVEKYLKITKETINYLKKAKDNFTVKYTGQIMESFRKYANVIIGDTVSKYDMDAKLHLSFRDGILNYPVSTLSAGQQDIVYLCLRGALLDVCFTDEKPVIIMDDPFVNLDEEKLSLALDITKELSKTYQIIYLCCHCSRKVV